MWFAVFVPSVVVSQAIPLLSLALFCDAFIKNPLVASVKSSEEADSESGP